MKALFHTGVPVAWAATFGDLPWCLLPVGGKPLIEYGLEWAAELGVAHVRVVLGDGAEQVEAYCGDGARWGLKIDYGFLKDTAAPAAYLRRSPAQWLDGLLYVCGPVFPRRLQSPPWPAPTPADTCRLEHHGQTVSLLSRQPAEIQALIDGAATGAAVRPWAELALAPQLLRDVKDYYDLNLRLLAGENRFYVLPGYWNRDDASIGYNVQIPPAVDLRPPLIIGNDCRINPMAVIGPRAVIGNHVIIDRQAELVDCVVLDGTYVGRNVEIRGKIVSGGRVISPGDGTVVDLGEPWLLASLGGQAWVGDAMRAVAGWLAAVALLLLLSVPFALLLPVLHVLGSGGYRLVTRLGRGGRPLRLPLWGLTKADSLASRMFMGLSLELVPLLALVVLGRLWLCGHAPLHPERDLELRQRLRAYFPAAIGYHTRRPRVGEQAAEAAEALYYERYRSLAEDLRLLLQTVSGRALDALAQDPVRDA